MSFVINHELKRTISSKTQLLGPKDGDASVCILYKGKASPIIIQMPRKKTLLLAAGNTLETAAMPKARTGNN